MACGIRSLNLTIRPLVCVPLESTREDEAGDDDADDDDDEAATLLPAAARFSIGPIVVVVRVRLLRLLLPVSTF